jgi:hypothetical protein
VVPDAEECLGVKGKADEYICVFGKQQPPGGVSCWWYLESNVGGKPTKFGCCGVGQ